MEIERKHIYFSLHKIIIRVRSFAVKWAVRDSFIILSSYSLLSISPFHSCHETTEAAIIFGYPTPQKDGINPGFYFY